MPNDIKDNNDNSFLAFILSKCTKLVQATYLLTNPLSDNEPLKWELRGKALNLRTEGGQDSSGSVLYNIGQLEKLLPQIQEIINLIDIALVGGSVSQMNFTILKQEFVKLASKIREESTTDSLENYLKKDEVLALPPKPTEDNYRPSYDHPVVAVDHRPKVAKSIIAPAERVVDKAKHDRKTVILQYLTGKGWTSIKDIAAMVKNCSRKTVQRELAELVLQGTLKKQGDRRWSRYILVK